MAVSVSMSTRLEGLGAVELAVDVDENESTRTRCGGVGLLGGGAPAGTGGMDTDNESPGREISGVGRMGTNG